MTEDSLEVLSAFIDGEAANPEMLARALAAPGAFEALLDFARMRFEIATDRSRPTPRFYTSMEKWLSASPGRGRRVLRAAMLGFAAVLLVGIGVAAGISLRSSTDRGTHRLAPPPATREVSFTKGVDWFQS